MLLLLAVAFALALGAERGGAVLVRSTRSAAVDTDPKRTTSSTLSTISTTITPSTISASVDTVLTYRAFCRVGGDRFPLSAIYPHDANLQHEEAAFWGFLWAGHRLGSEAIYKRLVKRLEHRLPSQVVAILGHMQVSLLGEDTGRNARIAGTPAAEEIVERILRGQYDEAHKEIWTLMEEESQAALGARLMLAQLIAQFPASIYSPATSKALLAGKLRGDLQQLLAVRRARSDPGEIPPPAELAQMDGEQASRLMFVHFVAGNYQHAAAFGSQILRDRVHGDDAHEIVAASLLCNGASARAARVYSAAMARNKHAHSAVRIGRHLADKGIRKQDAIRLYAKYALGNGLDGHFPLISTVPASPAVHGVIVSMLTDDILHLKDIQALKLGGRQLPPVHIPVFRQTGEQIVLRTVPTDAALAVTTGILSGITSLHCMQCKSGMTEMECREFLSDSPRVLNAVKVEDTLRLARD